MLRLMIGVFSFLLATSAFAQGFNYTYVEGGLAYVDDRTGTDFDAYGGFLAGSYDFGNSFYAFAGYSDVEFDAFSDFDVTEFELGGGFHTSVSDSVDFIAELSWITADVDVSGYGGDSDDGVNASIGLRAWGRGNWEFSGGIGVEKYSDSDNDAYVYAGADYYFTENISAGVIGAWSDSEIGSYGLKLRYLFDN